jgi:hypothetical protein
MTPEDMERVDEALRYGGVEELRAEVRAALERANDVGEIDAFMDGGGLLDFACIGDKWDLELYGKGGEFAAAYTEPTADAARSAAARAINNGEVG